MIVRLPLGTSVSFQHAHSMGGVPSGDDRPRLTQRTGRGMKHESCRELYRYWDRIRGSKPAPARADVVPAEITDVLRDTFILQSDLEGYPFRLAGTRLCAIHGRELKGTRFLDWWKHSPDRSELVAMLEAVTEDGQAAICGVSGRSMRDRWVDLELLLLPLVHAGQAFDRVLGVMAPMQLPYWLGVDPLVQMSVSSSRIISPHAPQTLPWNGRIQPSLVVELRTAAPETRRERFTVVEGGRSE